MDIKYQVICEWVEGDLLHLKRIDTSINLADLFTKQLGTTLFYRHTDFVLGHVPSHYATIYGPHIAGFGLVFQSIIVHNGLWGGKHTVETYTYSRISLSPCLFSFRIILGVVGVGAGTLSLCLSMNGSHWVMIEDASIWSYSS